LALPFQDALTRRLGIIQQLGLDATEQNTNRLARQRAQQQALQTAASSAAPTNRGASNYSGPARWEDFGLELQRRGFKVSENPDPRFGGKVGTHTKGSRHYSGRAFDVNAAPGTSAAEQRKLREAVALARQYGIPQTIFMAPGHYGHAHFGW
jgi:hypothetical protein